MIYFFVKDNILSGMKPGTVLHKCIACHSVDVGEVRKVIKRSGFTIIYTSNVPTPGYKVLYWLDFPRLEVGK